jgi:hypothetical protein
MSNTSLKSLAAKVYSETVLSKDSGWSTVPVTADTLAPYSDWDIRRSEFVLTKDFPIDYEPEGMIDCE